MTEERQQELAATYAAKIAMEKYPDEYQNVETAEDLQKLFAAHQDEIVAKLGELTEEDWDNLDQQESENARRAEQEQMQFAAKGAKLKKLQKMKSGGAKKCKCGCDLVTVKEKGGKITTKCACNCGGGKMSKNKNGGVLNFLKKGGVVIKQTGGDISKPIGASEKKGGIIKPAEKKNKMPIVKKEACGGKVKNRIEKAKLKK